MFTNYLLLSLLFLSTFMMANASRNRFHRSDYEEGYYDRFLQEEDDDDNQQGKNTNTSAEPPKSYHSKK